MHYKLSSITLGYAAFIIISAAFMLGVRNFLFCIFGDFTMNAYVRLSFVFFGVIAIICAIKKTLSFARITMILSLFILTYFFSAWQPYFSERSHVLTYGLLGFLAARDLLAAGKNMFTKNLFKAIIFAALISGADELFQSLLPYRVCDFRDFVTNDISAIFGIALLLVFRLGLSR
jgi:hypothetical protein